MEALNFLKFWKPTIPFPTPVIELGNDVVDGGEEEEDSFFDLEITSPKFDVAEKNDTVCNEKVRSNDNDNNVTAYPKPSLSLPPIDPIPKRKILPLEPAPKPQSPIALLKSAPNFRAFSFKKSKSAEKLKSSPKRLDAMESPQPSRLTRDRSSRRTEEDSSGPERFSKDVIHKYLRLVKPLYVKVSKRYNNSGGEKRTRTPPELFAASPSASPANISAGIRVVCKHLGKSKSTTTSSLSCSSSNAAQTTSSLRRRDDSLLQYDDGIQSAILHCKRSFNSSRDSCSLSRSTSDSSSMKSCSIESYRISHSASETSHDNSARNSLEDGRGVCV